MKTGSHYCVGNVCVSGCLQVTVVLDSLFQPPAITDKAAVKQLCSETSSIMRACREHHDLLHSTHMKK